MNDFNSPWNEAPEKYIDAFLAFFSPAISAGIDWSRADELDPTAREMWKLRLVKEHYERGQTRDDLQQLFRFIDSILDLPRSLEIEFRQELNAFEQEKRMPEVTSIERLAYEKGLLAGKIEEKIEGWHAAIAALLVKTFGDIGQDCLVEIHRIQDEDKLLNILLAIKSAKSLDEVRPLWS